MASKSDKKRRARAQQQRAQLRPGEAQGTFEVTVDLAKLEDPEDEYYANTAKMQRRGNFAQFFFGQVSLPTGAVHRAVAIDIPYTSVLPLKSSFADPGFREKLRAVTGDLLPIDPFVASPRDFQAFSYATHIVRMLLSDYGGLIDFYELESAIGTSYPVVPVLRVKCLPAVVGWFVDTVDELIKDLESTIQKPSNE